MLLVECKPDEKFLRTILSPSKLKGLEHKNDKGRVISILEKCSAFKVGIVDEDPDAIEPRRYRARYKLLVNDSHMKINVYKTTNNNYLVEISPRLEEWIIRICRLNNIDITEYNLPKDPDRLHKRINVDPRKIQRIYDEIKETREVIFLKNKLCNILE